MIDKMMNWAYKCDEPPFGEDRERYKLMYTGTNCAYLANYFA